MHYSIAFKHRSITERPPLGEILYPPLINDKPLRPGIRYPRHYYINVLFNNILIFQRENMKTVLYSFEETAFGRHDLT